ncbi:hypothetical protein ASG25_03000 [Rhizobium sp. Leaf384]|uniref:oligosaccharide flippase family protein n=1 Tax=Rhizobium sp. Leaf384 TaxID=1736358 RepID=UPI000714BA21|nr:oligosaccharide flippase family protein [Rhizobium sp. Leaf384]KQS80567.1 hypothetical protein ASG25_03000 [Rhizobium sp. Leaf384]KQS82210.1 hypothetical protein ASG58_22530 [Rhizobium sp. Leaf383]
MSAISKGGALLGLTAVEMMAPFVRMVIMTHLLGGFELGFAAALSAVYGTVEQVTDTGLARFVLATPRDQYRQALAVAHGISVIRGLVVGCLFFALAHPVACMMSTCDQWTSFASLAALTFIRSLENLEIRVYERDYRYGPQLLASILSHSCGLVAILIVGLQTRAHDALLAYLFTQCIVYVIFSHVLAPSPVRFGFSGPLVGKVTRFSLPLMLNGTGNAIMVQGDRLFVGAMLGLETLGLYAVIILTSYVPTSALFRLIGPICFAGLMNSSGRPDVFKARLKLYSRAIPMLAALYAVGWITLGSAVIPAVFGSRFVVSDMQMTLVGVIVYLRICRAEPAQSLLIQSHLTHRLAVGNQIPAIGLAIGATWSWMYPSLEALLAGMAIGEVLALCVMYVMARRVWTGAWGEALFWNGSLIALPLAMGLFLEEMGPAIHLLPRIGIGMGIAVGLAILALVLILPLFRHGYRREQPIEHTPKMQKAVE